MPEPATPKAHEVGGAMGGSTYQEAFGCTRDTPLVADSGERYVDANQATTTSLGYSREDLLRPQVANIVAGQSTWMEGVDAHFPQEGQWSGEIQVRWKDGMVAPVEAVATAAPGQTVTIHDFQAKWRDFTPKERSASRSHVNVLCRALSVPPPTEANPNGTFDFSMPWTRLATVTP